MAVKNNIPSALHNSVYQSVSIVPADTTNFKTLLTLIAAGNSNEAHLFSVNVQSDDTVNKDLLFAINDGTNDIRVGIITIPALSGETVNIPPVNVIANRQYPIFSRCLKNSNGNWYVPIYPGETLKVKALVTLTAAKTIILSASGYNFNRS